MKKNEKQKNEKIRRMKKWQDAIAIELAGRSVGHIEREVCVICIYAVLIKSTVHSMCMMVRL